MNRFLPLMVLALAASPGCIVHKYEENGSYDPPASSGAGSGPRSCGSHPECKVGCYCDVATRICRTSGTCSGDADCPAGFTCDYRFTCVPGDDDGSRPDAGHPAYHPDAAPAPDARPADHPRAADASPPPPPPAADGGSCPGGGGMTCTPRCHFSQQCGPGARCLDGRCQRPCTALGCGTGAVCRDGFCQPDDHAGGQCVYSSQCGPGGACISGFCHPGCASDGDCPNRADVCDRGLCRPDERPLPPCTATAQCHGDDACVDGLCRPACTCDADCAPWGSGATCPYGYCVAPEESVR
jgi:hypothetical protein